MNPWQRRIPGYDRHHASSRHEHALHVDSAVFIPQDVHHGLSSDVTFRPQKQHKTEKKVKLPQHFHHLCVNAVERLTIAPVQQRLPFMVSAPSFFYLSRSHVGVDGGKVELTLSVPPAFASSVFPHLLVFFVYLGRYSVLVGDVAITHWRYW